MRSGWAVVLVAALLGLLSARAADSPGEAQLRQGIQLLEKGQTAAAAAVFEKLSRGVDRGLAARALLFLGESRERYGRQQARQVYERLAREFPDRSEAAEARQRLASLAGAAAELPAAMQLRQVWANAPDNSGNPSPDGRFMTFVDWETGDLAVRDLATGQNRRLTQKGSWMQSREYAEWPKFSPDGKHVAYSWSTAGYGHELRVVEVERAPQTPPRTVLQIPDIHYIIPWAWSPDGQQVLALLSRGDDTNQLVWIALADGALRPLKSLEWRWPVNVSLSPDGRFITYDLTVADNARERDIFLMAADGSQEFTLVRHPADDYAPVWTPDGKSLLFASTRTGTVGVWSLPIAEGQATGAPELVKGDLGQIMLLRVTRDGALYFLEHRGTDDVYSVEWEEATGKLRSPPVRLVERFIGRNSAAVWSPDGRYVAYFSNRDPAHAYGVGSRDIVIRSLDTGRERAISGTNLDLRLAVRWLPDSQSVLIAAGDTSTRARTNFLLLNVATGEMRTIARANVTLPFPVVHPAGRSFLVAGGDQASGAGGITSYDITTGEAREVYRAPAGWVLRNLALSGDGKLLAFSVAQPELRRNVIYTLPAEGGELREVVRMQEALAREGLAWSAGGKHLLFVKTIGPNQGELYRVAAEGGVPQSLGISDKGLSFLSVHPKGERIAYTVGQYFRTDVWALENFLPGYHKPQ
jgi:Tol biopolymer transport system component